MNKVAWLIAVISTAAFCAPSEADEIASVGTDVVVKKVTKQGEKDKDVQFRRVAARGECDGIPRTVKMIIEIFKVEIKDGKEVSREPITSGQGSAARRDCIRVLVEFQEPKECEKKEKVDKKNVTKIVAKITLICDEGATTVQEFDICPAGDGIEDSTDKVAECE